MGLELQHCFIKISFWRTYIYDYVLSIFWFLGPLGEFVYFKCLFDGHCGCVRAIVVKGTSPPMSVVGCC